MTGSICLKGCATMSAALPTNPTYAEVANTSGRGTSVKAPRMSRRVMPYEATSELSPAAGQLIATLSARPHASGRNRR